MAQTGEVVKGNWGLRHYYRKECYQMSVSHQGQQKYLFRKAPVQIVRGFWEAENLSVFVYPYASW